MNTTRYFREQILRKRPEIRVEWCEAVVKNPTRREIQPDGRIRHWGYVAEKDRYLRVITLADGETLHNAFLDRRYQP